MAFLKKPTAHWLYELDSTALHTVGSAKLTYLEVILEKLQHCIAILGRDELFIPSRVMLSQWVQINGDIKKDLEKETKYFDVEYGNMRVDSLILKEILDEQHSSEAVRPADIEIHGWSRLADENGVVQETPNLVSVNAFFMGGGAIDIRAFGDKWLPYSFDGKTRHVAYEQNAGRLEVALQEIERFLVSAPIFDDFSDFCAINKYRLENFMDADENIIGVDELGRVL